MVIKIIQPAGLGDILFCLKIAKTYISQGHTVYWPVIPQYLWIKDYIEFEGLIWEDTQDYHKLIDIQSAGRVFPDTTTMDAKYRMAEMDYSDWKDYMIFKRKGEKEEKLYELVGAIEPYCLICDTFASPPGSIKRYIPENETMKNIYLTYMPGYTPFDWYKIIEGASELRLVDTCFIYMIEKMDNLKAKEMYLYSREGFFYTDHLWKKSWKYIK